jgi:hypothetical protein
MKATIIYSAQDNVQHWKDSQYDAGKKTCAITVKGEDGNQYGMYLTEGKPYWDSPKGTELEVEISKPAADGQRGLVKLPGTGRTGGSGFVRREYKTPTHEQAKEAADFAASLFVAIHGRMKSTPEAAATITAAIIQKLC